MPSRKRSAERKQNNVHHKEKKTKHKVLGHCVSSQITLAAPRLGAEEGVGRTKKRGQTPKNAGKSPTTWYIFFCHQSEHIYLIFFANQKNAGKSPSRIYDSRNNTTF